jgi:hypothetical protein
MKKAKQPANKVLAAPKVLVPPAERQELAVSGSPQAAGALYRDLDGDEYCGDDALFKALLSGATAKGAGYLAGVSERTVFRRMADPAFKQRLENAREQVRDSILSRLTDAAGDAVDTLHQLLDDDEPSVKLGAAKSLLDALVKVQNASPKQTTTVRYSVEQTKDA